MDSEKNIIKKTFTFRFYAELNDFLSPDRKQKTFDLSFKTPISIRETLESIGIPLSEVDLVLVNGISAGMDFQLKENDQISVYPMFESIDISSKTRVREKALRVTKFILDAHLGKLAKYLRMLGFDTLYENNYDDAEIISLAALHERIILTRDKLLLQSPKVTHGYFVRATEKHAQLIEVVRKFDLTSQFKSFTRCMTCNSMLTSANKDKIADKVEPGITEIFDEFYLCKHCDKVYWKGSHFLRMEKYIRELI